MQTLTLGEPLPEMRMALGSPEACASASAARSCGVRRSSNAVRGCGSNCSGHCSCAAGWSAIVVPSVAGGAWETAVRCWLRSSRQSEQDRC